MTSVRQPSYAKHRVIGLKSTYPSSWTNGPQIEDWMMDSLDDLNRQLKDFAVQRDWEQFHNPKNLAMALAGESGELLEHFQWLTAEQSADLGPEKKEAVALEMADILIYLIRLSERLDLDLVDAAYRKMAINQSRYPAQRVRGDARRAEEYDD